MSLVHHLEVYAMLSWGFCCLQLQDNCDQLSCTSDISQWLTRAVIVCVERPVEKFA